MSKRPGQLNKAQKAHIIQNTMAEYSEAHDAFLWLQGNDMLEADVDIDNLAYAYAIRFAKPWVQRVFAHAMALGQRMEEEGEL